jgi:hypothetical protein
MAAGATAKVATATPSSAAERSIEVAFMDITGFANLSDDEFAALTAPLGGLDNILQKIS